MKITIGETSIEPSQSSPDINRSTQSLVECYQAADNWCTKRQILSILAQNMTKQRLMVRLCFASERLLLTLGFALTDVYCKH